MCERKLLKYERQAPLPKGPKLALLFWYCRIWQCSVCLYFQTDQKHLFRTSVIAALQNSHNPFISSTKFCSAFFRSSFVPDAGESLFDFPHCSSASSVNNSVSCQHFPPPLLSRQAGKPICRILQGVGCLPGELGPWALLGTGRVLRGVHQLHRPFVLWGHSVLPHHWGICWLLSWQCHTVSHITFQLTQQSLCAWPCSPEGLPSHVPHLCQNPSHLNSLVTHWTLYLLQGILLSPTSTHSLHVAVRCIGCRMVARGSANPMESMSTDPSASEQCWGSALPTQHRDRDP